jgi:hypothetical protein
MARDTQAFVCPGMHSLSGLRGWFPLLHLRCSEFIPRITEHEARLTVDTPCQRIELYCVGSCRIDGFLPLVMWVSCVLTGLVSAEVTAALSDREGYIFDTHIHNTELQGQGVPPACKNISLACMNPRRTCAPGLAIIDNCLRSTVHISQDTNMNAQAQHANTRTHVPTEHAQS